MAFNSLSFIAYSFRWTEALIDLALDLVYAPYVIKAAPSRRSTKYLRIVLFFSAIKTGPLQWCFPLYFASYISAKYKRVICLSPSFMVTFHIYAENEHFSAAWSYITSGCVVKLLFEGINPPRVICIFAQSLYGLRFVSQIPPGCFL